MSFEVHTHGTGLLSIPFVRTNARTKFEPKIVTGRLETIIPRKREDRGKSTVPRMLYPAFKSWSPAESYQDLFVSH